MAGNLDEPRREHVVAHYKSLHEEFSTRTLDWVLSPRIHSRIGSFVSTTLVNVRYCRNVVLALHASRRRPMSVDITPRPPRISATAGIPPLPPPEHQQLLQHTRSQSMPIAIVPSPNGRPRPREPRERTSTDRRSTHSTEQRPPQPRPSRDPRRFYAIPGNVTPTAPEGSTHKPPPGYHEPHARAPAARTTPGP